MAVSYQMDRLHASGKQARERRGGRQKGTKNRTTIEQQIRAKTGISTVRETGVMPLDIILTVARGGKAAAEISDRQFAAAPDLHARLSAVAVKDVTPQDPDFLRRQAEVRAMLIARLEEIAVPEPL